MGKEITLHDCMDPLGAKRHFSDQQFREVVLAFKLNLEEQTSLDETIMTIGNRAIASYKQRQDLIKGPSEAMFARTIHMINYHLSETLAQSHHGSEAYEHKFINTQERQKRRKVIAEALLKEDWIPESIDLYEKQKMTSTKIEDQFGQEMQIITSDKRLSNHKRHQRLVQLIERVQDVPENPQEKIIQLNAQITGTDLIWARARFDQSQVQANKFNKLAITIFSKLSTPIKIESLELILDHPALNQTVNFVETQGQPFGLKK